MFTILRKSWLFPLSTKKKCSMSKIERARITEFGDSVSYGRVSLYQHSYNGQTRSTILLKCLAGHQAVFSLYWHMGNNSDLQSSPQSSNLRSCNLPRHRALHAEFNSAQRHRSMMYWSSGRAHRIYLYIAAWYTNVFVYRRETKAELYGLTTISAIKVTILAL